MGQRLADKMTAIASFVNNPGFRDGPSGVKPLE
jgi:hypothetical protein